MARTPFARARALLCRVQRGSSSSGTTAIDFAHGEKIVGLCTIDGLIQSFCQTVSHVLDRNMRLIDKLNDIVALLALVSCHCSQSFHSIMNVGPVWTGHDAKFHTM